MTYTPAQISASRGGDVFYFDYAHADVAQTFTFGAGSWGLYRANNVSVRKTITPLVGSDGITSIAGNILFSVTTAHLDTFSSCHVEWEGSGVVVEYSTDGGKSWRALTQDGVIPLSVSSDLDFRVSFAGGAVEDPSVLTSLTAYVLTSGAIASSSGLRTLSIGKDPISDAGVVTNGRETISAAPLSSASSIGGTASTGSAVVTVGSFEMLAAVASVGTTVLSGSAFSFSIDASGVPQATGCTVYINGVPSDLAPTIVTSSVPYHFVVVPNTPVNEKFSVGAGLTLSNLALYAGAGLQAADAFNLYTSNIEGFPTIVVNDSSVIGVTETSPATQIYAYAWSIVSGGGQ